MSQKRKATTHDLQSQLAVRAAPIPPTSYLEVTSEKALADLIDKSTGLIPDLANIAAGYCYTKVF